MAKSWGRQSRSKLFGNNLEFRDRKKLRYNWDNKEIEENDPLVENPITAVHPCILEEIPGVELEADREDINTSAIEAISEPSLEARADAARLNANLTEKEPGVPLKKIAGVNNNNDVIVIDDDSSDSDVDDGYNTDDTE